VAAKNPAHLGGAAAADKCAGILNCGEAADKGSGWIRAPH